MNDEEAEKRTGREQIPTAVSLVTETVMAARFELTPSDQLKTCVTVPRLQSWCIQWRPLQPAKRCDIHGQGFYLVPDDKEEKRRG